jgi:hypothetical protein
MQRSYRGLVCIVQCALWMTAVSPASATLLLPADFGTVVTESQTIAHGRVISVTSAMTAPTRRIETVVTLAVIDAIKGAAGSTVSFRVPNGQVGRYRRIVVGAPEFAAGDEVIVFLQGRGPAIPSLFGLSQGVYRVTHDAASRAIVSRPPIAAEARVVRGDPARQPLLLDAFVRGIHEILERRP